MFAFRVFLSLLQLSQPILNPQMTTKSEFHRFYIILQFNLIPYFLNCPNRTILTNCSLAQGFLFNRVGCCIVYISFIQLGEFLGFTAPFLFKIIIRKKKSLLEHVCDGIFLKWNNCLFFKILEETVKIKQLFLQNNHN